MDNLFFLISKTLWLAVQPDNLLVLLLVLTTLGGWLRRRWASSLLSMLALAMVALMLMPFGNLLLNPLESRFKPEMLPASVAGIMVLGGGEDADLSARWGQSQFNSAAERLMVLPQLMQRYPDAQVLFSGGSAAVLDSRFRGADVAKAWLDTLPPRLSSRPVLFERDSRNTWENALFSARLLGGVPQQPWLLVTSAFHMPRSVGIYRQLGWQVVPYPVDYISTNDFFRPQFALNLRDLVVGVREWTGLLIYHLTGRTSAFFPAPEA
ncbi:YdcF family protein [Marinobacterium rhizophilum]|uniref:YdcF family protein n=1 Tax=Marinobacterium rhizophilum TaxID=420402 RepID=A0ABY5HGJ2_9GAMM|nr:YdcF family protein [Marinobacterium rhizophilum]UTW10370.1 YdcF family protein [Marinobacterium rhizophilum]